MTVKKTMVLILSCGMLIAAAAPLCRAQEPGGLHDVKRPQAEIAPAFAPVSTNTKAMAPAQPQPAKIAPERSWYWRFFEMIAINAAEYNTVKQSDGRPGPQGNFRGP